MGFPAPQERQKSFVPSRASTVAMCLSPSGAATALLVNAAPATAAADFNRSRLCMSVPLRQRRSWLDELIVGADAALFIEHEKIRADPARHAAVRRHQRPVEFDRLVMRIGGAQRLQPEPARGDKAVEDLRDFFGDGVVAARFVAAGEMRAVEAPQLGDQRAPRVFVRLVPDGHIAFDNSCRVHDPAPFVHEQRWRAARANTITWEVRSARKIRDAFARRCYAAPRLRTILSVSASAAKKHSSASSDNVTSTGVPNTIVVVKKERRPALVCTRNAATIGGSPVRRAGVV